MLTECLTVSASDLDADDARTSRTVAYGVRPQMSRSVTVSVSACPSEISGCSIKLLRDTNAARYFLIGTVRPPWRGSLSTLLRYDAVICQSVNNVTDTFGLADACLSVIL